MRTNISAERVLEAPAGVVYHLISDYREHHRPEGFLPPAFTEMVVEQGGVRIDGAVVSDRGLKVAAGTCVVQVGKRKFARVTLTA